MRYASPRVRCMPTIYGTSQYLAKKVVMTTSFLLKNSILLHRKKSDEDYSRGRKKKRDDWLVAMVITFPRQVSASPFSLVPYAQGGVNLSSSLLLCLVYKRSCGERSGKRLWPLHNTVYCNYCVH